jgi:hypothetical protein
MDFNLSGVRGQNFLTEREFERSALSYWVNNDY